MSGNLISPARRTRSGAGRAHQAGVAEAAAVAGAQGNVVGDAAAHNQLAITAALAAATIAADSKKTMLVAVAEQAAQLKQPIVEYLVIKDHEADKLGVVSHRADAIIDAVDVALCRLSLALDNTGIPADAHMKLLGAYAKDAVFRALQSGVTRAGQRAVHVENVKALAWLLADEGGQLSEPDAAIYAMGARPWANAARVVLGALAPGAPPWPAVAMPLDEWLDVNKFRISEAREAACDTMAAALAAFSEARADRMASALSAVVAAKADGGEVDGEMIAALGAAATAMAEDAALAAAGIAFDTAMLRSMIRRIEVSPQMTAESKAAYQDLCDVNVPLGETLAAVLAATAGTMHKIKIGAVDRVDRLSAPPAPTSTPPTTNKPGPKGQA